MEAHLEPHTDSPRTIEECLAVRQDFDSMAALAFARRWPEGVRWLGLQPWQRIGPELLCAVAMQSDLERPEFLRETVAYLKGLGWVASKRLSDEQLILAANDAVDRLMYRRCTASQISALAVACRKETFIDLRSEAVAFLAHCLYRATDEFIAARFGN